MIVLSRTIGKSWETASYAVGRELNPGPLAPEARIMPLDHTAASGLLLRMLVMGPSQKGSPEAVWQMSYLPGLQNLPRC